MYAERTTVRMVLTKLPYIQYERKSNRYEGRKRE